MRVPRFVPVLLAACLLLSGCSVKRMAANGIANSLAEGGSVFTSDDDPELIRDALPFGLKTMETLLEIVPRHRRLLLAACQGYAQYAYAFVQLDADLMEPARYEEAARLRDRALKLFLRARGYGLRGLELERRGITRLLQTHPDSAARMLGPRHVPLLFWTAAAWGAAINLGKDRPDLVADLEAVRALIGRGLDLEESYQGGALHEAMIALESLPPAMGGSPDRARRHFARAVELSQGLRPGPFVALAEQVSVASQNRGEFRELLGKALAMDPDRRPESRLTTLLLQRKASTLLEREEDLFLAPDTTAAHEPR